MDAGAYFLTLEYLGMGAVFIALILIFLYAYYGKEEETVE
jgi:Na+-transporting methylmalonyl-CoA/oxaloacetate decarboxylase gamma subunit